MKPLMTQDHSLHCSLSSGDGRRQIRDFSPERCNTGCTLACNCVGHKPNKLSLDKQCSDIRLNGVDVGRQTRRLPRSARAARRNGFTNFRVHSSATLYWCLSLTTSALLVTDPCWSVIMISSPRRTSRRFSSLIFWSI